MTKTSDLSDAFGVSDTGTGRMPVINPHTNLPYVNAAGDEAYIEFQHWDGPKGRLFEAKQRAGRPFRAKTGLSAGAVYAAAKLAAVAVAWSLIDKDGKEIDLPFNEDTARGVFEGQHFLRNQAFQYCQDYANFGQASSQN